MIEKEIKEKVLKESHELDDVILEKLCNEDKMDDWLIDRTIQKYKKRVEDAIEVCTLAKDDELINKEELKKEINIK